MANPRDDYDAVPMRPVTDEEIEALTIINLDDCPSCEAAIKHTVHCPTPETHNWGCGCPSDVIRARGEALDRILDVEAGLQQILDRGKEA